MFWIWSQHRRHWQRHCFHYCGRHNSLEIVWYGIIVYMFFHFHYPLFINLKNDVNVLSFLLRCNFLWSFLILAWHWPIDGLQCKFWVQIQQAVYLKRRKMDATIKQDLPPEGGYQKIKFERNPAKSYFRGNLDRFYA